MDLVLKTDITGPDLIKEIIRREPGTSIDGVLNLARKIQVERHANVLRDLKFDSVLDLIKHIHTFDLASEDLKDLVDSLAEDIPELDALARAGIFEAVYHLTKPEPEEPKGCFCFRSQKASRNSSHLQNSARVPNKS
jgi:hypothetical protein